MQRTFSLKRFFDVRATELMYTYVSGTLTLFASQFGEVPYWSGMYILRIFMKLSALNIGKYYYNLNQHTYAVVLYLQ